MPSAIESTVTAVKTACVARLAAMAMVAMVAMSVSVSGCANLPQHVHRPVTTAYSQPERTPLGGLVQARRGTSRSTSGFALLDGVESAYTARMALIAAARQTLDLQYYAVHADGTTEQMLQALRDAARRGVRVRILLDDFNTSGRNAQVLRLGFEPQVELRLFNPLMGSRASMLSRIISSLGNLQRLQQRMHNKLFIADNAMGITGGRNLGDSYFGFGVASNFVDLDVLAAGSVVRDMSRSFDQYWNNPQAYPVQSLTTLAQLDALKDDASTLSQNPASAQKSVAPSGMAELALTAADTVVPDMTVTSAFADVPLNLQRLTLTWAPATLMVDKADKISADQDDEPDAQDTLIDGVLQLMDTARKDLLIVSPYFVPGERMLRAFAVIRARGVRVRVLTNSLASTDAPIAHAGYARYRERLLAMGVELFEMRSTPSGGLGIFGSSGNSRLSGSTLGSSRASLHSKALVVDSRLAVIGSMNLDLRSQLQNTEVALVIRSAAMAAAITGHIERTLGSGAYRLELGKRGLVWRSPDQANFPDDTDEPGVTVGLNLLVRVLGPLAPEEML
ncbi:MAG: phospholipase D family protein [Burkholderiaceae bacterium]|nr:phospholipase D family protein [Burkholderiaceae bacterium]